MNFTNKQDEFSISHRDVIAKINNYTDQKDVELDITSHLIPNGPQRIRGIAGSGKTVKICQMAATAHAKYPDWNIGVVFFTQSLYDYMNRMVDDYCSANGIEWDRKKLKIMHAWGNQKRDGLYRMLCSQYNFDFCTPDNLKVKNKKYSPTDLLAKASRQFLLKKEQFGAEEDPLFDILFIDEGQDLLVDKPELLYNYKQPVYWMAYEAIKPVSAETPHNHRFIWGYDEYQNMNSMKIPSIAEIFGNEDYFKGIQAGGQARSLIMRHCYRTPAKTIMAAHAIGMGLFYSEGMLTGPTQKKEWEALGYDVNGTFKAGNQVTLLRTSKTSPNPVSGMNLDDLMTFKVFSKKEDEYKDLALSIKHEINENNVFPGEIVVISLNKNKDNLKTLLDFLTKEGIPVYLSSTSGVGKCDMDVKANKYSEPGAVTLSRVIRAKGNEGYMVYITDLEETAKFEGNIHARNRLFVAMTRTRAWVRISGTGKYRLFEEFQKILETLKVENKLVFTYKRPSKWVIDAANEEDIALSYQETLHLNEDQ